MATAGKLKLAYSSSDEESSTTPSPPPSTPVINRKKKTLFDNVPKAREIPDVRMTAQELQSKLDKKGVKCIGCGYKTIDLNPRIEGDKIISTCAFCNLSKYKKNIIIDPEHYDVNGISCRSCNYRTKDVNKTPCKIPGKTPTSSERDAVRAQCLKCNKNKFAYTTIKKLPQIEKLLMEEKIINEDKE